MSRLATAAAVATLLAAADGPSSAQELPAAPQSPAQRLAAADAANPQWREAAARALPAGWVLGRLYRLDDTAGTARFAAFPQGADTPWTPGNAFDPGRTVEVTLNGQVVAGVRVTARAPDDGDGSDEDEVRLMSELRAATRAEAASGITVCRIRGWALSESSAGTPVRRTPSDDAPIAGRLAPPYVSQDTDASSIDGWRAEFDITGYKDGWFRIAHATAPGSAYDDEPPRSHPRTYAGTGWVRATDVTGAYANTQMPVPRLLQYPHVDAQPFQPGDSIADHDGNLPIDGTLVRLHACSADWALTTSRDGQRGWWRGICSNQATNCS